jgi:phage FluMu protein Com
MKELRCCHCNTLIAKIEVGSYSRNETIYCEKCFNYFVNLSGLNKKQKKNYNNKVDYELPDFMNDIFNKG